MTAPAIQMPFVGGFYTHSKDPSRVYMVASFGNRQLMNEEFPLVINYHDEDPTNQYSRIGLDRWAKFTQVNALQAMRSWKILELPGYKRNFHLGLKSLPAGMSDPVRRQVVLIDKQTSTGLIWRLEDLDLDNIYKFAYDLTRGRTINVLDILKTGKPIAPTPGEAFIRYDIVEILTL